MTYTTLPTTNNNKKAAERPQQSSIYWFTRVYHHGLGQLSAQLTETAIKNTTKVSKTAMKLNEIDNRINFVCRVQQKKNYNNNKIIHCEMQNKQ